MPAFEAGAEAAELWSQVALVYNSAGHTQDCVAALDQQRRIAQACGHVETEVAALSSLSGQHLALGDSELAVREAREAAQLYRRMGAQALGVIGDVNLATALIGRIILDILAARKAPPPPMPASPPRATTHDTLFGP